MFHEAQRMAVVISLVYLFFESLQLLPILLCTDGQNYGYMQDETARKGKTGSS